MSIENTSAANGDWQQRSRDARLPVVALRFILIGAMVVLCSCATRQQVEQLEERLVSMDDTLQQVAEGQRVRQQDASNRLDLLEEYVIADAKGKAHIASELRSRRQVRRAAAQAAAAQFSQDDPQGSMEAQQPGPQYAPPQQPDPMTGTQATVASRSLPPGAPLLQNQQAQLPPAAPAPVPAPGATPEAAVLAPVEPAPIRPNVVKRTPSEPSARPAAAHSAQPTETVITEAPPAGSLELDPNRVVSTPILSTPTPRKKTPPAAAPQPKRPRPTPETSYEDAVKLVKDGNVSRGRQLLNAFIQENPQSKLLPNAYYWLGETFYHDKRYAQAILTFREVTSRYPKHDKAAAALLKIGFAYEQLGDKPNARFYLGNLLQEYPNSEPATLAKEALDGRLQ